VTVIPSSSKTRRRVAPPCSPHGCHQLTEPSQVAEAGSGGETGMAIVNRFRRGNRRGGTQGGRAPRRRLLQRRALLRVRRRVLRDGLDRPIPAATNVTTWPSPSHETPDDEHTPRVRVGLLRQRRPQ
jgi:hypothetical protein